MKANMLGNTHYKIPKSKVYHNMKINNNNIEKRPNILETKKHRIAFIVGNGYSSGGSTINFAFYCVLFIYRLSQK